MWELIKAGGWLMAPIILCSIIALAVIIERFWTLRRERIAPAELVSQVWEQLRHGPLKPSQLDSLRLSSPLGRVLAAGLANLRHDRAVMKESIEEVGRHEALELERYLNTLGTIAAVTPLLGLLGTVFGMITVFNAITVHGVGDPGVLASGISQALITTAAGLSVAIPTLIFHRFFRGRVGELVVSMEQESLRMVEILHGDRSEEQS